MNMSSQKMKSKLQSERERRGWSRKRVAHEISVSDYTVGQWERGKHTPYAEHIEKLCDLFNMSAEALGLTEVSLEARTEQIGTTISSPHKKQRHLIFSACGVVLVLAVALGVSMYVIRPLSSAPVKPGGAWISPVGSTVGDVIHFAAYAYPTHNGDPAIDHVNFTVFWQGVDPRTWKVACVASVPIRKDVFACDANLRLLEAQAGQLSISFDVYDRQGNVNLAPNGKHTLMYLPGYLPPQFA